MALRPLVGEGAAAGRVLSHRLVRAAARRRRAERRAARRAGHAALRDHQSVLHDFVVRAPADAVRDGRLREQPVRVHDAVDAGAWIDSDRTERHREIERILRIYLLSCTFDMRRGAGDQAGTQQPEQPERIDPFVEYNNVKQTPTPPPIIIPYEYV